MNENRMTVQNNENRAKEATRDQHFINPAVDIYETEDVLMLVADMPGVEKDNLEINVDQGVLTVSGESVDSGRGEALYREFRPAGYFRQFRLLDDFDAARAEAELKGGVLTLRLPKSEAAKPRKIEVKTHH